MFACVLTCGLLCVLLSGGVCECVLKSYMLRIEKGGCDQCVSVNTTVCSGLCYSQDTNMRGHLGKKYLVQQGCMPGSLIYRAARVSGCPAHVSPQFYYPEYSLCRCTRCRGNTHRCGAMRKPTPTAATPPRRCAVKPPETGGPEEDAAEEEETPAPPIAV